MKSQLTGLSKPQNNSDYFEGRQAWHITPNTRTPATYIMRTISTHKTVEIAYVIDGFQNYAFGKDKALYNTRTGRRLRHTINGGRKGWWIGKSFMAHNTIRQLLRKPDKVICPF